MSAPIERFDCDLAYTFGNTVDNTIAHPHSAPPRVSIGSKDLEPRPSDSRRGAVYMLGAVVSFVAMVTFVKLLREQGVSTAEVMTWRMAPGVPLVAWSLWRRKISWRPRRPRVLVARVLFGGTAMAAYFWAVESLSLFANTTLSLTQPVFVALLAPWVLRERPGRGVAIALVVALAGAMMVVVPSREATFVFAAVAWLPVGVRIISSICSAMAHMSIRRATREDDSPSPPDNPDTVVLHFMGWVALASLIVGATTGGFAGPPPGLEGSTMTLWIAAMATCGLAGQLLLSRAYAHGRAPAVALIGYASVPLSLILDATVWSTTVSPLQLLGAAITVAAGATLVLRR